MSAQTSSLSSLQRWIAPIIFVCTTIVFFYPIISGKAYFWDDFVEQVYPNRYFAAKQIAKGETPHWNPYSFSGMPFQADVQSALYYPPHYILDRIAGGGTYPIGLLQLLIVAHFLVAQLGMYYLSRSIGVSEWSAVFAAISYGFSAPLALHTFHPMNVEHLAWFPFVVMFAYKAITKMEIKSALLGGLTLGMMLLSGSAQMTLFMVLFVGVMMVWLVGRSFIPNVEEKTTQPLASVLLTTLMMLIGVGMFCVQYLPTKELASLSQRNEMTYEKAKEGSLQAKQLLTAVVAKSFGTVTPEGTNKAPFFLTENDKQAGMYMYWDTAFYAGVLVIGLGFFALYQKRKHPLVIFLGVMSLFGFLYALGDNGFVFPAFFHLPFFSNLRIPARMMFYFSFGFSILAALGIDALLESKQTKQDMYVLIGAFALPLLVAFAVFTGGMHETLGTPNEIQSAIESVAGSTLVIIILGLIISFLAFKKILNPVLAVSLLCVLAFIDVKNAHMDFNLAKQNPVRAYDMQPELKQLLTSNAKDDFFRINMRMYNPSFMALKRNQGMVDDIMMLEGYNQLLLAKIYPPTGNNDKSMDFHATRHRIVIDSVQRQPMFVQSASAFTHAWMCYQTKILSVEQMKASMPTDTSNFRNVVWLEEKPSQTFSGRVPSEVSHKLKCTNYTNNAFAYDVESAEAGMLCFSEVWYPAWVPYIDGKPAKLYCAYNALRAIEIPAGKHTVEMRFESSAFAVGSMISLGTTLASIAFLAFVMFKEKKK